MSVNIFSFSVSAKTNLRKQVKSQWDGRNQNRKAARGHIFGYDRVTRLTFATLTLACTENVSSVEVSYG